MTFINFSFCSPVGFDPGVQQRMCDLADVAEKMDAAPTAQEPRQIVSARGLLSQNRAKPSWTGCSDRSLRRTFWRRHTAWWSRSPKAADQGKQSHSAGRWQRPMPRCSKPCRVPGTTSTSRPTLSMMMTRAANFPDLMLKKQAEGVSGQPHL